MLVLTRKKGETIQIGNEITLQVLEIRGNRVRLGIQAPKEIPIHRSEMCLTKSNSEKEQFVNRDSVSVSSPQVTALKGLCNWMVRNRLLVDNPLSDLSKITKTEEDIRRKRR